MDFDLNDWFHYPLLDRGDAITRAKALCAPTTIRSRRGQVTDPKAYHYGKMRRADKNHLTELMNGVRAIAEEFGFPNHLNNRKAASFDAKLGVYLFNNLRILPAEASDFRMWNFFSLVMLPDVTAWRNRT